MSEYTKEDNHPGNPPSLLFLTEGPRTLWDLMSFSGASSILSAAPHGDGHPVLVIPGFMASDGSTYILRRFLKNLGYQTHGWKMGRNMGPKENVRTSLRERLEGLGSRYNQKVSLIGQSLGGIYAREISRADPNMVRQVITLGSPFGRGVGQGSPVRPLFEYMIRQRMKPAINQFTKTISDPLPVPGSAIYSKFDGIVDWRDCVQKTDNEKNLLMENIEVMCSHCGMGVHPAVLYAIADRLAQPENEWTPFPAGNITAISQALTYPSPEPVTVSEN